MTRQADPSAPDSADPADSAGNRRVRALARLRGTLADTQPLRTPGFRRLWLAGAATVVGSQLSVVAVPFQVYDLTGSSAYVGLTGLFGLVPLIVFGLWGGAIADAMDRRTVLLVSAAGIALSSLALWLLAIGGGSVWLVLSVYALQQACLAVNQPTRGAVIPRLLPADQLPAANALNMMVFVFGSVAGPLLAGALLPIVGLGTLYLIDTVALTVTLWATWRLPSMPPLDSASPRGAGLRDILAGFAFVARQKILLVSFLVDIIAMAFGMPRAVFPEAAVHTFGDPPGGGPALGWLYAAISIGSLVGVLFSGWLHRVVRQGVAVTVSICVWGLGVALFGLVGSLWLAVVFLAVAGAADLVSAVYRTTMLQVVATDELRGRMQGVFTVVVGGGPRLADVWHGPAAAVAGTAFAATAGGIAVIVLTVAVVAMLPAFWRYRAR